MKLTIGKKITLGFISAIAITAGLGTFNYTRMTNVENSVETATADSLPGVTTLLKIQSLQRKNATNAIMHILSTNPQQMAAIDKDIVDISGSVKVLFDQYEALCNDDEEKRLFDNVKTTRAAYVKARSQALDLSRDNKNQEAIASLNNDFAPLVVQLDNAIQSLVDYNQKAADASVASIDQSTSAGKTGTLIGVAAALITGVGISYVTTRSINSVLTKITTNLSSGAVQVNSASTQVAAASQSLAQGASEQAASLEETSSSLEEISSMTKKNADTAQQASVLSTDAKAVSDKGNAAMAKMSAAIADIQKSATETAKIIKTIDEIAFQTNLLALNAAVEAARAGEAGKGFAVVAEEVRNLAMRSAEAAKNTAALIDGSVTNAKNGVVIADEVATNLAEITEASAKVNLLVAEIAAACNEQSAGIGQVNQSIQQMDKVTQSNAAAAEESAASAEELSTQSEQLTSVVSDLTRLVLGDSATTVTARPAPAAPSRRTAVTPKVMPMTAKVQPAAKFDRSQIPLEDGDAKNDDFSDFNLAA